MNAEELARLPDAVHIPTVLGAVVVTYNAPVASLRLTPAALADVFLGKITRWNDPALAQLNPGVGLPDLAIVVAHAPMAPAPPTSSPTTSPRSRRPGRRRWAPARA
jgi:phosphate transport system substrate-binding protein